VATVINDKFGRNYVLLVEASDGETISIQPPFTIEFDITRNTLSSANICSIRIYNLSLLNRQRIEFNIYDQGKFRLVRLMAGYGNNLPIIFNGNINQAWSVREGTNFITQIESFDGGYAVNNAKINLPAKKGTPYAIVIAQVAASLQENYNVSPGLIGDYPGVLMKDETYSGSTLEVLSQLTHRTFFIDNGTIYCLLDNECIINPSFTLVDAGAGLLGTPVREQKILTFDVLFEPRVIAGQIIQLQSATAVNGINGNYKVTGVKHRGMISQAVCGDAITTLSMFLGDKGPQSLRPI